MEINILDSGRCTDSVFALWLLTDLKKESGQHGKPKLSGNLLLKEWPPKWFAYQAGRLNRMQFPRLYGARNEWTEERDFILGHLLEPRKIGHKNDDRIFCCIMK